MVLDKHVAILIRGLKKLDKEELTHIITYFDKKGIHKLCECVWNTIYTNLKLPKSKKNKIKAVLNNNRSKKNLAIILKKSGNKLKKKAAILQEGEGLGLILSAIAPLIASLFTGRK